MGLLPDYHLGDHIISAILLPFPIHFQLDRNELWVGVHIKAEFFGLVNWLLS